MMSRLAQALQECGYATHNWSYPSLRGSITSHAQLFRELVCDLDRTGETFHVVGHSMGGIIVRAATDGIHLKNAGRMVMLGPPNGGSPVAKNFAHWFGYFCPVLHELSDDPNSLVKTLTDTSPFETGVVAASYDNVVPLLNTHLPGQCDHKVVAGRHASLPFNKNAIRETINFLGNGCFAESAETRCTKVVS